jgi:hypothetical protein
MNTVINLVRAVEAAGGHFAIEDEWLVVEPREAGEPLLEELLKFKPEIMSLIRRRSAPEFTNGMDDHDPAAWAEDFQRWMAQRCVSRPRKDDWAGIGWLWVDFCEWTTANNSVPCKRRVFERLVVEAGFRLNRGMVGGLLLMKDLEGYA